MTTGAHFKNLCDIKLEADERLEDLYQRLVAFIEDNLLYRNTITHHGEHLEEDEELTPTIENLIVVTWLRLIHAELLRLVKQRYCTELRTHTLASIKPEIKALLDEVDTAQEMKVMHAEASRLRHRPAALSQQRPTRAPYPHIQTSRSCPMCKQAQSLFESLYIPT
jgi:hypothetical protein